MHQVAYQDELSIEFSRVTIQQRLNKSLANRNPGPRAPEKKRHRINENELSKAARECPQGQQFVREILQEREKEKVRDFEDPFTSSDVAVGVRPQFTLPVPPRLAKRHYWDKTMATGTPTKPALSTVATMTTTLPTHLEIRDIIPLSYGMGYAHLVEALGTRVPVTMEGRADFYDLVKECCAIMKDGWVYWRDWAGPGAAME